MSVINLNDTIPAAPAGFVNIKWQADDGIAPRNVSAYVVDASPVVEEPAGTINGTNTVFTLSFTPNPGTLVLDLNGVIQNPGTGSPLSEEDFTITGPTITYVVPLRAGDKHTARYTH